MSNLLNIKGSRVKIYKTLPSNTVGNDGDIILSQIQGRGVYLCSKVNGKWHVSSKMEELRKIENTSTKDLTANKLQVLDNLAVGRGTTTITKDEAKFSSSLKIKEASNAISDTVAYGQLWVKNSTPNELYFTTDAGNDIQLTSGTTAAFVGDITSVVAGDGLTGGGTTGDVTLTVNVDDSTIETNSDALRIKDDGITYAKIQNVSATDRILGRDSSGAGVIEEITPANLRTMINVADGATANAGTITGVTAGTNCSGGGSSGSVTINVDDAFLINSGDDTTSGTITAGGFTTTGTWTFDDATSGTVGITTVHTGSSFTDNDTSLMTAGAIKEKIENYSYQTALTFGIANTNAVKIDAADVADDDYARFTANGLEGRTLAEIKSDIGTGNSALVPAAGSSGHFLKHDGTFGQVAYSNLSGTPSIATSLNDLSDVTYSSGDLTITSLDTIVAGSNLTIDAVGDITLDADGGDIIFKDNGTTFASTSSSGMTIETGGTQVVYGVDQIMFDGDDLLQYATNELTITNYLKIAESASANSDSSGKGQLWVKNDTPNNLYFTNDAGNDVQITNGASLAGGSGGTQCWTFTLGGYMLNNNSSTNYYTSFYTNYFYWLNTDSSPTSIAYTDAYTYNYKAPKAGVLTKICVTARATRTDPFKIYVYKAAPATGDTSTSATLIGTSDTITPVSYTHLRAHET